jgi:CHAT domain-containing protein/tetratricopeptide (TPR) repeat protein
MPPPSSVIRLVSLLCLLAPPVAHGQEPPGEPLTAEQRQQLRDYNRARAEFTRARADGKLPETRAAAEKVVTAARAAFGPNSDAAADALDRLAALDEVGEDFAAARTARGEVLRVRVGLHDDKDWRVIEARLLLERSERLARLDADSRRHLREAWELQARVQHLRLEGRLSEALVQVKRALARRHEILGDADLDTAELHNELGLVLAARADYVLAREALNQALATDRRLAGEDNPRTALVLGNLASLSQQLGDYREARALMERALTMLRRARGADDPDTATLTNNLGTLLHAEGDLAGARRLFERALAVRREAFGEESVETAVLLNNLGNLLQAQGDRAAARPYLEQSLAIYEKELTASDPRTLRVRNNLGLLLHHLGEQRRGRAELEEVLRLTRQTFGDEHPETARALYNLAHLLRAQKEADQARQYLEKALAIRRKSLGDDHPDTADTHFALGLFLLGEQRPEAALRHCEEGLAIRRRVLGDGHPNTAQALLTVGFLKQFLGDDAGARPCLEQSLAVKLRLAREALGGLSEAEGLAYVAATDSARDPVLSALRRARDARPEEALAVVWDCRALVTRAVQARRDVAAATPAARPLWDDLRATRAGLARLTLTEVPPDQAAERQKQLTELNARKERLERELAAVSAAYRRQQEVQRAGVADLAKRLPPGVAVVDIVQTNPFDLRLPSETERERMGILGAFRMLAAAERANIPHYEAFVLHAAAGRTDGCAVARVDLGPSEPIGKAVGKWREALEGDSRAARGDLRPLRPVARPATPGDGPEHALRRLVWEKIEPHLGDCATVIVIPDADLTRVPWAALPGKKPASYLVEEYALATALHEQHLYDLLTREPPAGERFLLVGGVAYDADPSAAGAAAPLARRGPPLPQNDRPRWPALPGTLAEARQVAALWPGGTPAVLSGTRATRAAVSEQLPGARYVHLATHGFFADRQFRSVFRHDLAGERLLAGKFALAGPGSTVTARNPLLLSGVVLAGANGGGGGILTGEEVAELDLHDTELVVLSACDTGLGEAADGEGVFSLQRAFALAGARTVIASLWKVDDTATTTLMEEFYANLWRKKLSRVESLRQAQLTVLRHPERVNSRGDSSPPPLWAAFVLSGDVR